MAGSEARPDAVQDPSPAALVRLSPPSELRSLDHRDDTARPAAMRTAHHLTPATQLLGARRHGMAHHQPPPREPGWPRRPRDGRLDQNARGRGWRCRLWGHLGQRLRGRGRRRHADDGLVDNHAVQAATPRKIVLNVIAHALSPPGPACSLLLAMTLPTSGLSPIGPPRLSLASRAPDRGALLTAVAPIEPARTAHHERGPTARFRTFPQPDVLHP